MVPLRDDLRLLSIFHFVLAGFSCLLAFVPLIYVGLGVAIALGALGEGGQSPPPLFIGWLLVVIGLFLVLLALAYAVGLFVAGRSIARQRNWLFCMIMAGLSCPSFPFGTALGVFTLVILSKPEVKALFTAEKTPVPERLA
jgi:hypothetical protein